MAAARNAGPVHTDPVPHGEGTGKVALPACIIKCDRLRAAHLDRAGARVAGGEFHAEINRVVLIQITSFSEIKLFAANAGHPAEHLFGVIVGSVRRIVYGVEAIRAFPGEKGRAGIAGGGAGKEDIRARLRRSELQPALCGGIRDCQRGFGVERHGGQGVPQRQRGGVDGGLIGGGVAVGQVREDRGRGGKRRAQPRVKRTAVGVAVVQRRVGGAQPVGIHRGEQGGVRVFIAEIQVVVAGFRPFVQVLGVRGLKAVDDGITGVRQVMPHAVHIAAGPVGSVRHLDRRDGEARPVVGRGEKILRMAAAGAFVIQIDHPGRGVRRQRIRAGTHSVEAAVRAVERFIDRMREPIGRFRQIPHDQRLAGLRGIGGGGIPAVNVIAAGAHVEIDAELRKAGVCENLQRRGLF